MVKRLFNNNITHLNRRRILNSSTSNFQQQLFQLQQFRIPHVHNKIKTGIAVLKNNTTTTTCVNRFLSCSSFYYPKFNDNLLIQNGYSNRYYISIRSVGTTPSSNSQIGGSSSSHSHHSNNPTNTVSVNAHNLTNATHGHHGPTTISTTHTSTGGPTTIQTSTYSSSSSGQHDIIASASINMMTNYNNFHVNTMEEGKGLQQKVKVIDFSDTQEAFSGTSTGHLIRAYFVFKLCGIRTLVENSDTLLKYSYKILGSSITEMIIRHSFFNHFCAGETSSGINPIINKLYQSGIGSILDYAAEADVSEEEIKKSDLDEKELIEQKAIEGVEQNIAVQATGRIYDYESELKCDHHVEIFRQCIVAVKDNNPDGFAAIKVTALGNPILLERMSTCINEIRNLFTKMDVNKRGYLTTEEFITGYRTFFIVDSKEDEKVMNDFIDRLDRRKRGKIDYIEWMDSLTLLDDDDTSDDNDEKRDFSSISSIENNIILSKLVAKCKETGPLAQSILDSEEVQLLRAMIRRLETLSKVAEENNVRLMVDAEQTYFQPAIDNLIVNLQRRFNKERPIIYTTYQCYLKDSSQRLLEDLKRARKEEYYFAAKLVRGAYMISERARAVEKGYESPVHETLQDTHISYNQCVANAVEKIAQKEKVEILIATHNQESVERTLDLMQRYKLDPKKSGVYFGQLLGMCDHLTSLLGKHGYNAYKYVPYGPVGEVIPYLIRRAQENASMFDNKDGKDTGDIALVKAELRRRIFS